MTAMPAAQLPPAADAAKRIAKNLKAWSKIYRSAFRGDRSDYAHAARRVLSELDDAIKAISEGKTFNAETAQWGAP